MPSNFENVSGLGAVFLVTVMLELWLEGGAWHQSGT